MFILEKGEDDYRLGFTNYIKEYKLETANALCELKNGEEIVKETEGSVQQEDESLLTLNK
jgi:hypothetical protein